MQNLTKEQKQPPAVILQQAVFLQYIYSVLVVKNHQNIRSRWGFFHKFCFTDIFNDINLSYRAGILKKNYSGLLPFYMAVATYCYYEKLCRTMCTAIVSFLFNNKISTIFEQEHYIGPIVFIRQALAIRFLLQLYLFLIVALLFLLNGFFIIFSSVILSSILLENGTAQVEL